MGHPPLLDPVLFTANESVNKEYSISITKANFFSIFEDTLNVFLLI